MLSPTAGFGAGTADQYTKPDFGITRNRKTHVIFNDPRSLLREPAFVMARSGNEIGRSYSHKRMSAKLALLFNLWVVKNFWEDESLTVERNEGTPSVLTPSAATISARHIYVSEWRKPDDALQLHVLTGASTSLNVTAPPMIRKRIPAGATWADYSLADETVFPFGGYYQRQFVPDSSIIMDRVYVSHENDTATRDLRFVFWVPSSVTSSMQLIYQLGFVGPATGADGQTIAGTGQYRINFYGNGQADLFEKLVDGTTWLPRMGFDYNHNFGGTPGSTHFKIIKVDFPDAKASGMSGRMAFVSSYSSNDSVSATGVDWSFNKNNEIDSLDSATPIYNASCGSKKPPTQETMIRVSERRDLRGAFQVAVAQRPASATLKDDIFSFPFYPVDLTFPIMVRWNGIIPDGCGIDIKLYRGDSAAGIDSELTTVASGPGYRSCLPIKYLREYYAIITLTTDGSNTPMLKEYTIKRDGVFADGTSTPQEFSILRGITLTGTERDPKHESARILISNVANDASLLRARGSIPVKVEVEWEPDVDPASRCVLFKGYTSRVTARRRTRMLNSRDASVWFEYNIQATGMYQQLRENVNPYNRRLWDDSPKVSGGQQPFKVTDLLRSFLNSSGIPQSEINVADLKVRAYALDGPGAAEQLSILNDLGDTIFGLQNRFLAHFLLYDPNSGTRGQWVLVAPKFSPYTNVAKFVFKADDVVPQAGAKVLSHARLTYAAATDYPTGFIKKGSMSSWVKPPEGNLIIASCQGKTTPNGVPTWHYVVLPNFKSYNFGNGLVDPTNPDFLDRVVPIYVMVPEVIALTEDIPGTTKKRNPALEWIARRVFDAAAHAIKFVTFEAPLLLIDEENPITYKKRPLRYYDPVLVDGEQFLIRNVNPTYRKDFHQMAIYECEAPRV